MFGTTVQDNVLTQSDLVAIKYPLLSAAWFWDANNLNTIADKGSSDETVKEVTKKVNGGYHGLEDRQRLFTLYYTKLTT